MQYAPNSFMGINYNSPTIQNMMNQNNVPSYSTTPTFANIGGLGYNQGQGVNPFLSNNFMNPPQYNQMMNGGYYSGYYNYNPQEIMRQMEEQRKAQEAAVRNQIEIQKMKARIFNTHNDIQTDEELLEEYFNPNTYVELQKDIDEYDEMVRLSALSNDPNRMIGPNYYAMNQMARISEEIRSRHPVEQSFTDFMNSAGDLYRDALMNENARELRKNIANSYNKQAYSQLTNMHNSSFASLRQAVSVDDLSISLPKHLQQSASYQERKNQFLNFITQNDVRNRGGL
jgi:hypothetical protein